MSKGEDTQGEGKERICSGASGFSEDFAVWRRSASQRVQRS